MKRASGKLGEYLSNKASAGVVVPLVKNHLLSKHGLDNTRAWDIIHPSEMAKSDWCHRATYLRIVSGKPPAVSAFDFGMENIFAEGNSIHAKWQKWLEETGRLWGDWECRVCGDTWKGTTPKAFADECFHIWKYMEIPLGLASGEHLIRGHADGAVDNTLIEFKSVGMGTLRIDAPDILARFQNGSSTDLQGLWRAIERPLKTHLRQGDIYLWLAEQDGLPFDKISYVYEFKANQQVKEFVIKLDKKRIEPLLDKADQIYAAVRKGAQPPDCAFGGCKQCSYFSGEKKKRREIVS